MIVIRALVLMLLCPAVADAATQKAQAIVAASKRATGGAAWDRLQGCIEHGTRADGATRYLTQFSLQDYGMRTDGERGGNVRSMGFDGKARWQSAEAGKLDIKADAASLEEAIVTNYLSVNGFYFPERFPATLAYVRSATEAGQKFDVVEVTPRGGRPFHVWFDSRSHLIQRVIDKQGKPPVTVKASDYRRGAGGLVIAHRLDVFAPDGTLMESGTVTSFSCGAIDTSIFAPPSAR